MAKSEGKSMELGNGNAKEARSTSIAKIYGSKLAKTHSNLRSIQKQIGAIFSGNFRISQNQRKIWWIWGWKHKSNPWQPCSDTIWCSLGLLGWPVLHGLTGDVDERTQEHEEHEEHQEERPEYKNTHTIQEPFPLPVGPTGPIESTRRWEIGK